MKKTLLEFLMLEMPYITLPDKTIIDLELERHTQLPANEFIDYIKDLVNGKAMNFKDTDHEMVVSPHMQADFIRKLLSNPFLRNTTIRVYNTLTWIRIKVFLNNLLRTITNE